MSIKSFKAIDEAKEKEICEKYLSGALFYDFRNEYDLWHHEVNEILLRNGVKKRHPAQLKRVVTPEIEQNICSEYVAGSSQRVLAEKYKVDRTTIGRVLRNGKVRMHTLKEYNVKKSIDDKGICEFYLSGLSSVKVAKEFLVTPATVMSVLRRNGVKLRIEMPGVGRKTSFTEEQIDEMVRLYRDEKVSISSIIKIFNSNTPTKQIVKLLKARGVEIRSRSDNNRTYFCDRDFFKDVKSQNHHYILGWIYTDGSIRESGKKTLTIELHNDDVVLIEHIRDSLKTDKPIYTTDKSSSILVINDIEVCRDLVALGLHQNKTKSLQYPNWIDDRFFPDFARGVIEGDGGIFFRKYEDGSAFSAYFCGASPMVVEFASVLESKYGIKIRKHKHDNTYRYIVSTRESAIKLGILMYKNANMILPRKFISFKNAVEHFSDHGRIDDAVINEAKMVVENIYRKFSNLF